MGSNSLVGLGRCLDSVLLEPVEEALVGKPEQPGRGRPVAASSFQGLAQQSALHIVPVHAAPGKAEGALRSRDRITELRREIPYRDTTILGQQNGVPPSVASLTTALLPLFVMVLAAVFLGEHLTKRRVVAFLVALVGLIVIAMSKGDPSVRGSSPK